MVGLTVVFHVFRNFFEQGIVTFYKLFTVISENLNFFRNIFWKCIKGHSQVMTDIMFQSVKLCHLLKFHGLMFTSNLTPAKQIVNVCIKLQI